MTPTNLLIAAAILLMYVSKKSKNDDVAILAVALAALWIALPK